MKIDAAIAVDARPGGLLCDPGGDRGIQIEVAVLGNLAEGRSAYHVGEFTQHVVGCLIVGAIGSRKSRRDLVSGLPWEQEPELSVARAPKIEFDLKTGHRVFRGRVGGSVDHGEAHRPENLLDRLAEEQI